MQILKICFSESFYSRQAVLEAVHEVSAQFPSTVAFVNGNFEVTISGMTDPSKEELVSLWITQLVNDGELRAQIEISSGRIRDVVVAAAFSRVVGELQIEQSDRVEAED